MGRGGINMGNESSLCLSLREQLPSAPAWSSKGTVPVVTGAEPALTERLSQALARGEIPRNG